MRILPSLSFSIMIISIQHVDKTLGQVGYEVRLAGSTSYSQGRVEVYANGAWGTVCDDGWGINDATVVCRQLGFSRATLATCCANFGRGSGRIVLSNVACTGSESNIGRCPSRTRYINCDHNEDAGVICFDGNEDLGYEVRLAGSTSYSQGRVEVYANGAWGTVCDDGWGINDATVVCRQLGFSRATLATCCANFGRGSGRIVLSNVACTGSEINIGRCPSSTRYIYCDHNEDAGVICFDGNED
ncbi:putative DMBT1-like protein isoform X2 [Asterias rubens]|nr:putative DMBT1-like protein isoform X2 [Asterias rubens]